ncbi:unnamed protein product, partial [Ectocarpus sp. 13 AM-2016]
QTHTHEHIRTQTYTRQPRGAGSGSTQGQEQAGTGCEAITQKALFFSSRGTSFSNDKIQPGLYTASAKTRATNCHVLPPDARLAYSLLNDREEEEEEKEEEEEDEEHELNHRVFSTTKQRKAKKTLARLSFSCSLEDPPE